MQIGRYSNAETKRYWQGWIEPEDCSWIIFVRSDGSMVAFLNRDPETGAVRAA